MDFDEFLSARLGPLLRYATVVTCDPHLAEDVTQEVLARAQRRWRRIGHLEAPEQYVRRMILNEFLSWRRRRAAGVVPLERERLEALAPPGRDHLAAVDERDLLLRAIAGLPPRQRAVIALRYYEDLPDEQIAALLGCRPVTVRSQASRALATLRSRLPLTTAPTSGGTR